jgi:hypothetical protein
MIIKAEFLAGSDIESAFTEAIRVSRILWVTVSFDFNGVECFGRPNGSVEEGVRQYNLQLKPEVKYKMAFS